MHGPIARFGEVFENTSVMLEILEDEIYSGKYKPAERMVEREIADRLGFSRVPVREALIILERW